MLPGIRQRCRWSKLQRVSPCWTASNPPHSHWWGWGGCWCFAREQSVFYSMTPLKVEPFTDFAGEEQPRSSSYPYHPPKASRGQSACGVWWTASGWSWLPPPTETGTATALPCSIFPKYLRMCRETERAVAYQWDIVQLSSLQCKGISSTHIFLYLDIFLSYLYLQRTSTSAYRKSFFLFFILRAVTRRGWPAILKIEKQ